MLDELLRLLHLVVQRGATRVLVAEVEQVLRSSVKPVVLPDHWQRALRLLVLEAKDLHYGEAFD